MRALVIEDERKLAFYIKKGLEEHHFAVDVAYNGEEGVGYADENEYDVVVLDLLLPKKDGMAVLRELREKGDPVPVLILTALDAVADKVAGLDAGADDAAQKCQGQRIRPSISGGNDSASYWCLNHGKGSV